MIPQVLLDFLYPPQCSLCGALDQEPICPSCLKEMPPASPDPLGRLSLDTDGVHAIFSYEDRAAQAVRRLKYSRSMALAEPMAAIIRRKWDELGGADWDMVVPVPIHWSRLSARGFNQAELLCARLPEHLVRPKLLVRTKRTKPQAQLSARDRQKILVGAFAAPIPLAGARVLLVDDVITTGGTAGACAAALKAGGAQRVEVLAFCGDQLPGP